MARIPLSSINKACECPFYVWDGATQSCFFKRCMGVDAAMSVTEGGEYYNAEYWHEDCEGAYDNCVILPLLYEECLGDEDQDEAQGEDHASPALAAYASEFDPFDDESDIEPVEPDIIPPPPLVEQDFSTKSRPVASNVKVRVHKVDETKGQSPYAVKCDVLVTPTNQELVIDDPLLKRLTAGRAQQECSKIRLACAQSNKLVSMGSVYSTSGQGTRAKRIYHAVLQGVSRLVKESYIIGATHAALAMAEENEAKVVVFIPFDCGMIDIDVAATAQLGAIESYLRCMPVEHITHIFIVMEDDESEEIFKDCYRRIFKKQG